MEELNLENVESMEIKQQNLKNFDINWDSVKTIKDMKTILKLFGEKVVLDFNDENDLKIYEDLKNYLS